MHGTFCGQFLIKAKSVDTVTIIYYEFVVGNSGIKKTTWLWSKVQTTKIITRLTENLKIMGSILDSDQERFVKCKF